MEVLYHYLRLVPRENLTFLGVEDVVEAVAGGEGGEGKGGGGGRVDPLVVGDGLVTLPSRTPFKLRCPACILGCVTPTAPHSFPADTSPLLQ